MNEQQKANWLQQLGGVLTGEKQPTVQTLIVFDEKSMTRTVVSIGVMIAILIALATIGRFIAK